MRNGPHFDGGDDRRAEVAAFEDLLQNPHGLIEAHVLVYRQRFAHRLRLGDHGFRSFEVDREGLLRQYGLDVLLTESESNQGWLLVWRERDVEDFDLRILDQRFWAVMGLRDAPAPRNLFRPRFRARRDRDDWNPASW